MKTLNSIKVALIVISSLGFLTDFTFGQVEKDGSFRDTGTDLDNYFTGIISQYNFVALGACLIKEDKIIWSGTYGYADREIKKAVKTDDIFHLASLSKTVTATALMQLYEEGLFQLDDDISNYIPVKVRNPNYPDKPISIRMLLTHTGGFADVMPTGNKLSLGVAGDCDIPLSEFIKNLFIPGGLYYSEDLFSKDEPGSKYGYSNIAFSLIGYLVEILSGQDFSEYCKENIFIPLDMKNTGWFLRDIDTSRLIWGYGYQGNLDSISEYSKGGRFGLPGYPEGMLRSTMEDFSHFISAFMNGGIYRNYQMLKSETVILMLSPQGVKNIPSRSYPIIDIGLTWLMMDVEGTRLYTMNGFSGKIFASAYFSEKDKTALIFFYTGITIKSMVASFEITRTLYNALKEI
jgi:CubicO group peptidase (beta-lactamase class C family)